MKCESLVRSRWIPEYRDGITVHVGYWKRLADPEPCREDGQLYKIRERARAQKERKKNCPKDQMFLLMPISFPAGTMWAKTALCDKHRKKAERENKEVVPVGESACG